MPLPDHLFVSGGDLYDTRAPDWSKRRPVRTRYQIAGASIDDGYPQSLRDIKAALRGGAYAWPGGYPLYFLAADGEALSFAAVRANFAQVCEAHDTVTIGDGWRMVGVEINYEDGELTCGHTGKRIESAYAEDDPEEVRAGEAEGREAVYRELEGG